MEDVIRFIGVMLTDPGFMKLWTICGIWYGSVFMLWMESVIRGRLRKRKVHDELESLESRYYETML